MFFNENGSNSRRRRRRKGVLAIEFVRSGRRMSRRISRERARESRERERENWQERGWRDYSISSYWCLPFHNPRERKSKDGMTSECIRERKGRERERPSIVSARLLLSLCSLSSSFLLCICRRRRCTQQQPYQQQPSTISVDRCASDSDEIRII